jgi:hypothetical protein
MHDAASAFDGRGLRRALRRWSIALAGCLGTSILVPGTARADEWGCQVMLCLSNPGGPEQYSECVPPVERLWAALRNGDPFPTCDAGAEGSQGTLAVNPFAGAGYCREVVSDWGGPEGSELLRNARRAINFEVDGTLYMWVWLGASSTGRTITGLDGAANRAIPYVPTHATAPFLEQESGSPDAQGGDA